MGDRFRGEGDGGVAVWVVGGGGVEIESCSGEIRGRVGGIGEMLFGWGDGQGDICPGDNCPGDICPGDNCPGRHLTLGDICPLDTSAQEDICPGRHLPKGGICPIETSALVDTCPGETSAPGSYIMDCPGIWSYIMGQG